MSGDKRVNPAPGEQKPNLQAAATSDADALEDFLVSTAYTHAAHRFIAHWALSKLLSYGISSRWRILPNKGRIQLPMAPNAMITITDAALVDPDDQTPRISCEQALIHTCITGQQVITRFKEIPADHENAYAAAYMARYNWLHDPAAFSYVLKETAPAYLIATGTRILLPGQSDLVKSNEIYHTSAANGSVSVIRMVGEDSKQGLCYHPYDVPAKTPQNIPANVNQVRNAVNKALLLWKQNTPDTSNLEAL